MEKFSRIDPKKVFITNVDLKNKNDQNRLKFFYQKK